MLTKWSSYTRLETRTKESNICASMGGKPMRNESEVMPSASGTSTDHDPLVKGLSMSISVGTRKMVNYA